MLACQAGNAWRSDYLLAFFLTPSFLGGKASHLTTLIGSEQRHTILTAGLSALAAHSCHDLRYQPLAYGKFFVFPYRLQDHAAPILNLIQLLSNAFWHTPTAWHGSQGASSTGLPTFRANALVANLTHYRHAVRHCLRVILRTHSERRTRYQNLFLRSIGLQNSAPTGKLIQRTMPHAPRCNLLIQLDIHTDCV